MSTVFFIARRYLFAKKSHNAINWVSGISMAGVAVATAAMVCVLSVFNGFSDFVAALFTAFDPEVRVELAEGKTVAADDPVLQSLRASGKVAVYTEVLEEKALLRYGERQMVVTVKGVGDNFTQLAEIDSTIMPRGAELLWRMTVDNAVDADDLDNVDDIDNLDNVEEIEEIDGLEDIDESMEEVFFCLPSIGVASQLGIPMVCGEELQLWAPKHGERVNMSTPQKSFRRGDMYTMGPMFCVRQPKYDNDMVIVPIDFARQVFDNEGRVSHVELRLADGATTDDVRRLADSRFRVLDRYEQQADSFRVMNIEKLMSYIFLTFILLVAAFNIVGSLSMLILEKSDDAQTLRALGASDRTVRRIFATEGCLISLVGAAIGLILGLLLCWIQAQFGVIKLGVAEGSFFVDAYPVKVEISDILLVFATVVAVSWVTVLWPIRQMRRG